MHSVIANKCTDSIRTMLPSTARNITCDTDIKGAITLAGEDVDARTLLTHSAALGPRFRGDDEIFRPFRARIPKRDGYDIRQFTQRGTRAIAEEHPHILVAIS